MDDEKADQNWHVDKRIPLALIGAVMLQTAAFSWWAASINVRVGVLEGQMATVAPQAERLIRVETKVDAVREDIQEIKHSVRPAPPR